MALGARPEAFHPALQSRARTYAISLEPQPPLGPGLLGSLDDIRAAAETAPTSTTLMASGDGVAVKPDNDVPSKAIPSATTFDSATAAQYVRDHAQGKSTGDCAAFVRRGLAAGGLNTDGHPAEAKDYGPFLKGRGASVVDPENYRPQRGDVVVYDGNAQHKHGHIQYYDGDRWISDFRQNGISPYRSNAPGRTIYRLGTQ